MMFLSLVAMAVVAMVARGDDAAELAALVQEVDALSDIVTSLTRQMMMTQLYLEEGKRSDGDSGVKQIRIRQFGSRSYQSQSHTRNSYMSIHDHGDLRNTGGMGEFDAVLNGVDFRTRHNDYKMAKAASHTQGPNKMEDVEFPPVPPDVTGTLNEQITKMREYFKAFQESKDPDSGSNPDYRQYFRPALCYLEGAWTISDGAIDEPFESDRHTIDAKTWYGLTEKIRFTSYTGRKNINENYSFLPMKIFSVGENEEPQFAQWNYRIACQPITGEKSYIRPRDLMLKDDLGARLTHGLTMDQMRVNRAARFTIHPSYNPGPNPSDQVIKDTSVLDDLMAQVPGRDGAGAVLHDDAFGDMAYTVDSTDAASGEKLNTANYHRFYKLLGDDASGQSTHIRGFSDANAFWAMTTDPKVPPMTLTLCDDEDPDLCTNHTQRWTYAIPLELVYLTPLTNWNPHNIEYKGSPNSDEGKTVKKGGRNGGLDLAKAWNGTNRGIFYRTPTTFYSNTIIEGEDPADTIVGEAGVLNAEGDLCIVRASGIHIHLPEIEGVGRVRMRYPIAPVYMEGSGSYKELDALKEVVMKQNTYQHLRYEQKT